MRSLTGCLLALAVALCPMGCGEGPRDASLALRDYYDDLAAARWHDACAHLTHSARQDLRDRFGTGCPAALARARPGAEILRDAKVLSARTRGDRATVAVTLFGTDPARPLEARLQLVGGSWKVTNPYSPFGHPLRGG